ncbi:MAG: YqgE/AlgH family protein [Myxococcota bacterium]|nr:YqgE/AlgH family protein [Myxococcota bacterium]
MITEVVLKAPAILIAVPQLADTNFSRAVVLLLEHQPEEGSMGVVLNRPTELELGEFCSSQDMTFQGNKKGLVYSGGPVQTNRAFLVHHSDHVGPETEDIIGRTKLSYSLESLELVSQTPPSRLRVFLGYAGWGPGQLATEVISGAWLVTDVADELIFDVPVESVWESSLRKMGIDPMQLMHSGEVH